MVNFSLNCQKSWNKWDPGSRLGEAERFQGAPLCLSSGPCKRLCCAPWEKWGPVGTDRISPAEQFGESTGPTRGRARSFPNPGSHAAAGLCLARAPPWRGPAAPALRPVRPAAPPPRGDPGGSSRWPWVTPPVPPLHPARWAFPSTNESPPPPTSHSGRPDYKPFPASSAATVPLRPGSSQAKQTKEPSEENLPNCKAKSLLPSFLGSTFHFKNNKSRNQKPPRLEVGVRGNAGGGAWFPRCAAPPTPPHPFLAPARSFDVIW